VDNKSVHTHNANMGVKGKGEYDNDKNQWVVEVARRSHEKIKQLTQIAANANCSQLPIQ